MAFYAHDFVPDSPINNFATLNPITPSSGTYSDGNLRITADDTDVHLSTIACPIGLISYFETIPVTTSNREIVGFSTGDSAYVINYYNWQDNDTRRIWESVNGTGSNISGHLNNDITGKLVGLSLDLSGTYINLKMYVDGTLLVNQTTSTLVSSITKPIFPLVQSATGSFTFYTNFGQDPVFGGAKSPTTTYTDANGIGSFHYQPPEGALALCTKNIPEGPIKLSEDETPSDHFKSTLYTGSNSNALDHDTGIEADLVWIKKRNFTERHYLVDSVRGKDSHGHSYSLSTDNTQAQNTSGGGDNFGTLNQTSGSNSTITTSAGSGYTNTDNTFVCWAWKAAGSPASGQAKIINEDGSDGTMSTADLKANAGASITPSKVSANQQNGFSIVQWDNEGTVPHGLSEAPEFIIVKSIDHTSGWWVYATALGNSNYGLPLHSSAAQNTSTNWGGAPDNNVFYVQNGQTALPNTSNSIAYIFHSVAGYSKIGSYVGNGSLDGPYVHCGFRPAFVMVKDTNADNNWLIIDSARNPDNPVDQWLMPNAPDSTYTYTTGDFTSSGFKLRNTGSGTNSSNRFLFMAFAEQPFSGPSNAR